MTEREWGNGEGAVVGGGRPERGALTGALPSADHVSLLPSLGKAIVMPKYLPSQKKMGNN